MRLLIATASAAIVILLVACVATPGESGADMPTSSPGIVSSAAPRPSFTGTVPPELLESIVDDAAERTGVDPAEVEVVSAEAVTWNDGSLGCPEPGQAYTQALVPGYRVIVKADDEELDFRVGTSGEFKLCDGGLPGAAGGN